MSFVRNTLAGSLACILVLAFSACGAAETSNESKNNTTNPRFTPVEEPHSELPEESNPTYEPLDAGASPLHPDDTWPGLLMGDMGPDLESSWLNKLEITGDYAADLRNVDFEPLAEDFEEVVTYHEEYWCETSFSDNVNRMGYSMDLERELKTDTVDWVRVMVKYNCPGRAETVDRLLIALEKNS